MGSRGGSEGRRSRTRSEPNRSRKRGFGRSPYGRRWSREPALTARSTYERRLRKAPAGQCATGRSHQRREVRKVPIARLSKGESVERRPIFRVAAGYRSALASRIPGSGGCPASKRRFDRGVIRSATPDSVRKRPRPSGDFEFSAAKVLLTVDPDSETSGDPCLIRQSVVARTQRMHCLEMANFKQEVR